MPAVRPEIRCARIREPSWCHALGRSSGVRAHSPVPSRIAELVALSAYPTHAIAAATGDRHWIPCCSARIWPGNDRGTEQRGGLTSASRALTDLRGHRIDAQRVDG